MTGYAHPIAFKAITDEHILKKEQFVAEKTLQILQQNLHDSINEKNCDVLIDDDELHDYFGDLYAQNPASFKFGPGDVLLIKELVDHVKTISDRNGKNTGLGHFSVKAKSKRKVSAKQTRQHRPTAHLFPGKKAKIKNVQRNENQLKTELQQKVLNLFNLYAADTEYSSVNIELSTVENKIYGDVFCVFCETQNVKKKTKRVVFNSSKGSGCWVLSNLTKHLENFHNLKARVNATTLAITVQTDDNSMNMKPAIQSDQGPDENGNESVVILDEILNRDKNITHDDPEQLFNQLSSQLTNVMASVLQNNEHAEEIIFTLNTSPKKLSVAVVPGDGSCLFSALTHQLWMHKINSKRHIEATKQLQADVVQHILDHFPFFEYHLKDRVYETKSSKEITDMSMECKLFVRYALANSKIWGGVETLLAVSNLYSTNIAVFNENGVCTKYKKADECYERTIAVAYRLNAKEGQIRNHFDSVFEANATDLYSAARHIAK